MAHKRIIEQSRHLGYKSDVEGVCFGIAQMGIQAILANDIPTFNDRLSQLSNLTPEALEKKINELKELKTKANQETKSLNQITDILAFFEGIELYYQPELYPDYFSEQSKPQNQREAVKQVSSLLQPDVLVQKGGIEKANYFSGMYSIDDLDDLFKSLTNALKNMKEPIAFNLHNTMHSIAIGYVPQDGAWVFIDANKLPAKIIKNDNIQELSDLVCCAFSKNDFVTFCTQPYTTANQIESLNKQLAAFKNDTTQNEAITAKAQYQDSNNITWLQLAIDIQDTELAKALIETGINLDLAKEQNKFTPLHFATLHPSSEILEKLLLKKANPNFVNLSGKVPLHLAAMFRNSNMVEKLLLHGANPNIPDLNGRTPLCYAVKKGDIDTVKILLKYGATPDLAAENFINTSATSSAKTIEELDSKFSPLCHAALNEYSDIANLLLSFGADPNYQEAKHINPLTGSNDTITKMLLAYKGDPNLLTMDLVSPVFVACQNKRVDTLETLLEAKADVNSVFAAEKATLLTIAEEQGRKSEMTKLLASYPDKIKNFGPIDIAAFYGDLKMVKLLMDAGAVSKLPSDINAASLARYNGHQEVVKFMTEYRPSMEEKKEIKLSNEKKDIPILTDLDRSAILKLLDEKIVPSFTGTIEAIKNARFIPEVWGILYREQKRLEMESKNENTPSSSEFKFFKNSTSNHYKKAILDALQLDCFETTRQVIQKSSDRSYKI